MPLDEALDRALKAYAKERLHPAPTDVVAKNIGYNGANNGTALQAIASLRYYGLLDRVRDGMLTVTKDVESFRFAPDDDHRRTLLVAFLRRPDIFAELLDKYNTALPSDGNLRWEMIQRGFLPGAAETFVSVFRRSVDFAGYFEQTKTQDEGAGIIGPVDDVDEPVPSDASHSPQPVAASPQIGTTSATRDEGEQDRIPVRLPGGRRAWLVIPTPFFESDKTRLKAQIDLLLTEDDV